MHELDRDANLELNKKWAEMQCCVVGLEHCCKGLESYLIIFMLEQLLIFMIHVRDKNSMNVTILNLSATLPIINSDSYSWLQE